MKGVLSSTRALLLLVIPFVAMAQAGEAQGCIPDPVWLTAPGGLEDITDPLTAENVIVRFDGDGTNHYYPDRSLGATSGRFAKAQANYVTAYAEGYLWAELGGSANVSAEASALLQHRFETECLEFPDHFAPPDGFAQHAPFSVNYLRYLVKGDGPAEKRITIRAFALDINGFSTLAEGDYEHPNALDDVQAWAQNGPGVGSDGYIPQPDIQYILPNPAMQDVTTGGISLGTYGGLIIEHEFKDTGEADLKEYQYIQWMSADLFETDCHGFPEDRTEAAEVEVFALIDAGIGVSDYSYLQFESKAGTVAIVFQQPVLSCFSLIFFAQILWNDPWVLDVPDDWRRGCTEDPDPAANLPGLAGFGLDRMVTLVPEPGESVGTGEAAFHVNVFGAQTGDRTVFLRLPPASVGVIAFDGIATAVRLDQKANPDTIQFDPSQPLLLSPGYWEVTVPLTVRRDGFATVDLSTDPAFPTKNTTSAGVECIPEPFTVADWRIGVHTGTLEAGEETVELWGAGDSYVHLVPLNEERWKGHPDVRFDGYTVDSNPSALDWIIKPQVGFDKERDSWFIAAYPNEAVDITVNVSMGAYELSVPISFPKEMLIEDPSTGEGF